ncbi:GTP-binding protein REM 2 [Labeo rohita]|uniref:GTP-binding protein REM 2 n=1 Tax=Labeo rohita TaxID=84645 RepID=A0ABQ8MY70_LABRO|nr:GTP-binding protein REM 2 [Labeo rohita]
MWPEEDLLLCLSGPREPFHHKEHYRPCRAVFTAHQDTCPLLEGDDLLPVPFLCGVAAGGRAPLSPHASAPLDSFPSRETLRFCSCVNLTLRGRVQLARLQFHYRWSDSRPVIAVTQRKPDPGVAVLCRCKVFVELSTLQCEVCILVFSLTDRRSFHRIAQLRLLLRETLPHTPIILVGNKSDLVRSREISTEEAHSSAMMFGCLYMELSVSLDHRTNDLLEAAVRAARGHNLGPGWTEGSPTAARRESLTSRAKRFLSGLVPRSHLGGRDRDREGARDRDLSRHRGSRMLRQKSRSCHDLSALM